ncbi:MAG: hypothetical protein Q4A29_06550 [Eubacteriales bacterium]|nr:hypothetical protein [Eubacteriales bacterium]
MTKQEYLQTMEESLTKFSKEETAPMMEYFREYMAETNLEYEAIPHMRTFRYSSVFGLQFRRYVM